MSNLEKFEKTLDRSVSIAMGVIVVVGCLSLLVVAVATGRLLQVISQPQEFSHIFIISTEEET